MRIGLRQGWKMTLSEYLVKMELGERNEVEYVPFSPIYLSFHQCISYRLQLRVLNYRN